MFRRTRKFPFLFGGTFIEGFGEEALQSFFVGFPFLFGGTFIEGFVTPAALYEAVEFPFLFGGTFIEGLATRRRGSRYLYFPSFSEGLSLRETTHRKGKYIMAISLPFRRDFH